MRKILLTLGASLLLLSCSGSDDILDELPTGSVKVSDEMYMIPLESLDETGCQGYRAHSPGNLVVQAIFYRTEDGEFTMIKAESSCAAE